MGEEGVLRKLLAQMNSHIPRRRPRLSELLKETVHELGHVFGLNHCEEPSCVMHFSNSFYDTDLKSTEFCPGCSSRSAAMDGEGAHAGD